MAEDFHKISMTARFTAYMRQYSDIPFAKDVAEYLQADEALETFFREQQLQWEGFLWYAPLMEIRYKSIAALIRKSGIKQVLELASGLSLRGLAMTEDPELTYIETDLEDLTNEKKVLISNLQNKYGFTRTGNHHVSIANAMDPEQLLKAAEPFTPDQPVAVVCEGLLPYLTAEERNTVAQNICALLRQFGGSWITSDFTLKQFAQHRTEQQKEFHRILAEITGRVIWDSAFESEEAMQAFFTSQNLNAEIFKQTEVIPQLVSEQALDDASRQNWERAKPVLRIWSLSL
jgi:O-methyltransferase involved in polyketide biosynthesis